MRINGSTRGLAILLSLVPGWGHVFLRRELEGLLIFTLAALGGFGLLNASIMHIGEFQGVILGFAAVTTFGLLAFSLLDVLRLTAPLRRERLRRTCDQLLWEGMICYLRSDFLGAEQKFLECARLDALDVEPVFRAGVAASRRGAVGEARRLLRRASSLDGELKWRREITEEENRLSASQPS